MKNVLCKSAWVYVFVFTLCISLSSVKGEEPTAPPRPGDPTFIGPTQTDTAPATPAPAPAGATINLPPGSTVTVTVPGGQPAQPPTQPPVQTPSPEPPAPAATPAPTPPEVTHYQVPRSGFNSATEGTLLHQQNASRRRIYDLRITLGTLQQELMKRRHDAQRLPKGSSAQKAAEIAAQKAQEQVALTKKELQQTQQNFSNQRQQLAQLGKRAPAIAQDAERINVINRDQVVGNMIARIPPGSNGVGALKAGELPQDISEVQEAFNEDQADITALRDASGTLAYLSQLDPSQLENNIDLINNALRGVPEFDTELRASLTSLKNIAEQRKESNQRERREVKPLEHFVEMDTRSILRLSKEDLAKYLRRAGKDDTSIEVTLSELESGGFWSDVSGDYSRRTKAAEQLRQDVGGELNQRKRRMREEKAAQDSQFNRNLGESFTMANAETEAIQANISQSLNEIRQEIANQQQILNNTKDDEVATAASHQLEILRGREGPLMVALQAASDRPDERLLANNGYVEGEPPVNNRIAQVDAEEDILAGTQKMKAAGESQEAIERWQEGMRIATAPEAEDAGSCFWSNLGGGVANVLWRHEWSVTGILGKGVGLFGKGVGLIGDVFGGIGSFFTTPVKQGLFATFSALAQYQYPQKGSQNENTQIYRGLATALGLNMAVQGEMPAGMEKFVDPLEPFKRDPLAMQDMIAGQDRILSEVLTIGGNPSAPGGYPYGTSDRLQSVLQGAGPGSPRFPASASSGFPGVFDPNFQNFSGQAYNGFPPQANIPVGGAYLNPQAGSQSPFYSGSGLASVTRTTAKPSLAKQGLALLVAATAVERSGVQNYRQQLEDVNPPDNSMVSIVGEVDRLAARNRELRNRGLTLSQIEEQQNASYINNTIVRQQARIAEQIQKLSNINMRIWEKSQEFRKHDIQIQRDDDGLMIGSRRDWSQNMEARNASLIELTKLRDERAAALEAIAFIRANPMLFERMLAQQPQVPQPKNNPQQPQELTPFGFLMIRPLWAAEELNVTLALDPNWKAMVQEEKQLVQKELAENQKKLEALKPELKKLVELDPRGVHEINVPILQNEELNMKAIALQAHQNLEKLKKAEGKIKDDTTISVQEKEETLAHIKEYRFILTDLLKESKQCANELAQVERLQRQKREQFEIFHHFREIGQKRLEEFSSL